MSFTRSELFYAMLPALHGLGGILAISLCFVCDTGRGKQTARIPRALPTPTGMTRETAFLGSFPWDESTAFFTHDWNPFALIFAFEWLTAAFAARPLVYYISAGRTGTLWLVLAGWLGLGEILFIGWTVSNSGGPCVAMACTVTASFIVTAVALLWAISLTDNSRETDGLTKRMESSPRPERYTDPATGRIWLVPRTLRLRRNAHVLLAADGADEPVVNYDFENGLGVILRYAEYCITAPLLFVAVVCFLTVDAPAWLFLAGYWFLFVCNALGVALHASFLEHGESIQADKGGILAWAVFFFAGGPWRKHEANRVFLLQAAWVSLLIPMFGLIFLIRQYLFSTQMPVLAVFMIWNLLVSYSLFGLLPTFIYVTGFGKSAFAWILDILNVAAKFPLPIVILSGFILRPASTKFCYN